MPTLFARRYARRPEAVGNVEKALGLLILLLTAGIVALYVYQALTDRDCLFEVGNQSPTPTFAVGSEGHRSDEVSEAGEVRAVDTTAEQAFPQPEMTGWRAPARVERYTPENLYVKIDGRAEAYLRWHVVGLTCGSYVHEADPARTIDVYRYDMGSSANAQAMYHSEQPPDAPAVAIGEAGYQVGGAVFFHHGRNYVQVLPSRLDEDDAQAALAIARRIASLLAPGGQGGQIEHE